MGNQPKYRLREIKTGKFLYYSIIHHDEYTEIGLDNYQCSKYESIFECDTAEQAELIRNNNVSHWSSSEDLPCHNFNKSDLEIVKVTTSTTEEVVKTNIPSKLQILKFVNKKFKVSDTMSEIYIQNYLDNCKVKNIDITTDKNYNVSNLLNYLTFLKNGGNPNDL